MQIFKRGEVHPETKMIFSHYKANGKIQWYSKEAWDNKIIRAKEFMKTERNKEYQKQWYIKNKEKKLKQTAINRNKRNEEYPLKSLLSSVKSGAKQRNLVFEIDYNYISELWINQKELCYYTKIPMKLTSSKKDPYQVSIDRLDSDIGYTRNNVVLCCQAVNYMKNDYKLEEFTNFLKSLFQTLKLI